MDNKIDGVKISVNNDSVSSNEKNKIEQTELKKVAKKAPAKLKKTIATKTLKTVTKKVPAKTVVKKETRKKSGFFQTLISIVVTASIVGGAMYVWQNRQIDKVEKQAEGETESVKIDLETRLANLKSKVTGVETTNVELKKTLEDLAKKAELLIGSKKEYKNNDLGLSFEYPASFGLVNVSSSTVASSSVINLVFENNDKLTISGVENSYKKISSSSVVNMNELKGFIEKRKIFYVLGPNDSEEFEINPAQIIEFSGGKALLLDKNSFVLKEGSDGVPVDIGDNVAFIVNLKDKKIPGLVIINSDFGMLPLNDFVLMMESFEVK